MNYSYGGNLKLQLNGYTDLMFQQLKLILQTIHVINDQFLNSALYIDTFIHELQLVP